jgi:tRNA(Ile)-lysidine synthetase-like protein
MKKMHKYHLEKMRTKLTKAIQDFSLIDNGDKILVGISGGKDSMALLDMLYNRKKALKINYEVEAVHIQLKNIPYHTDHQYLKEFCKEREIKFKLISSEKEIIKEGKQPCFYCAWNRRKLLFEYAKENNFDKIALGHHKDDAVETLLMNMVYHGEISSFPVKIEMFNGAFALIRPLIYLSDKELSKYVQWINYKPLPYDCPFAKDNKRESFRKLIAQLKEINPSAVDNIFNSMQNISLHHMPIK